MQPKILRDARNRREWTETQAAQRLGMSQSYLAMLESGQRRVTPSLARKFKAVYGLSPTALPTPDLFSPRVDVSGEEFASVVSALGYPGFAYMKSRTRERNPAEVLLEALKIEAGQSRAPCSRGSSLAFAALLGHGSSMAGKAG